MQVGSTKCKYKNDKDGDALIYCRQCTQRYVPDQSNGLL